MLEKKKNFPPRNGTAEMARHCPRVWGFPGPQMLYVLLTGDVDMLSPNTPGSMFRAQSRHGKKESKGRA